LRDEKGGSILIRSYKDIRTICRKIREKELVKNKLILEFGKHFNYDKLILFFERCAAEEIRELIVFLNAGLWHKREHIPEEKGSIVFLIERGLFYKYLSEYAKTLNINTKYYPAIVRLPFWKYLKSVRKMIKIKFAAFFKYPKHKEKPENRSLNDKLIKEEGIPPCIGTSYSGKSVESNLKKRSDFFWFLSSDIPREAILIYFDAIDVPAPQEINLDKMIDMGIRFISLRSKTDSLKKMPFWSPKNLFRKERDYFIKSFFKIYFSNVIKMNFAQVFYINNIVYFILKYAYWYDFFRTNNIKINVSSHLYFRESYPKIVALEKSGGINVACQYSNVEYINHNHSIITDVLFLFGSNYRWTVEDSKSAVNNIVYSGYITDHSFNRVKEDSQKLRKQLIKKGAKFIICFFDENSSDDVMSTLSKDRLLFIYERLLSLILADKSLGLICSPKNVNVYKSNIRFSRKMPEMQRIIEEVESTGRFVSMGGTRQPHNYPTEVAQAADLCIGLLLGGTAILESYLSGTPSIFIDMEKLYALEIYKWGKGRVVFDDINEMLNTIKKYRENPNSVQGFGDLSSWVENKDPFKDGNASLRIGQYIKWLHERILDGDTKHNAIEYANQIYEDVWGRET